MSHTVGGERAPSWEWSSSGHTALPCSDGCVSEQYEPALHPTLPQAFFFHLYGMILRECPSVEQVQCHLASLLDLSHQHSRQREVGSGYCLCLYSSPPPLMPHSTSLWYYGIVVFSHHKGHFTSLPPAQTLGGSPGGRTAPRELDKDLCRSFTCGLPHKGALVYRALRWLWVWPPLSTWRRCGSCWSTWAVPSFCNQLL